MIIRSNLLVGSHIDNAKSLKSFPFVTTTKSDPADLYFFASIGKASASYKDYRKQRLASKATESLIEKHLLMYDIVRDTCYRN